MNVHGASRCCLLQQKWIPEMGRATGIGPETCLKHQVHQCGQLHKTMFQLPCMQCQISQSPGAKVVNSAAVPAPKNCIPKSSCSNAMAFVGGMNYCIDIGSNCDTMMEKVNMCIINVNTLPCGRILMKLQLMMSALMQPKVDRNLYHHGHSR